MVGNVTRMGPLVRPPNLHAGLARPDPNRRLPRGGPWGARNFGARKLRTRNAVALGRRRRGREPSARARAVGPPAAAAALAIEAFAQGAAELLEAHLLERLDLRRLGQPAL